MKKVEETNKGFKFFFEDNEEATEFRDKLRDAGYSAIMGGNRDWILEVNKEDIEYTFFREWVMLKSPDKIVDNADHTPKNDLLSELKKLKDLNQYLQGEIDELREDKQNLEEKLERLL
jgi:hypothetical protein